MAILKRILNLPPVVHTVRLQGVIGARNLNLRELEKGLERAFDTITLSPPVAVAISVNSPGGSPVQSALICERIRALSRRKQIQVFTFAEDVAASGGYWLLTAGDKLFANRSSLIGSIGVAAIGFGFPDLLAKVGVERRVRVAGKNKGRNDPFTALRADDEAFTQRLLGQMHGIFKAHVTSRRGSNLPSDEASLEELFSGDVWLGDEAMAKGLVDAIGEPLQVMRAEFGDDVVLKHVSLRPQLPWPLSAVVPTSSAAAVGEVFGEAAMSAFLTACNARVAWDPYRFQ